MAKNYAQGIPPGNNGIPMFHSPPPMTAIATTNIENATASSILILNANTSALEVMTSGAPAYLKWLSQATVDSSVAGTSVIAAAATANYDAQVPQNTVRRFVIPIFTGQTQFSNGGAPLGANKDNGLYPNVAIKTFGIASVSVIQN